VALIELTSSKQRGGIKDDVSKLFLKPGKTGLFPSFPDNHMAQGSKSTMVQILDILR